MLKGTDDGASPGQVTIVKCPFLLRWCSSMVSFDRTRIFTVLLLLLVVFSVGLTAGTLDAVVTVETDPAGSDRELRQPAGDAEDRIGVSVTGGDADVEGGEQYIDLSICIEFLQRPIVIVGIIAGFLGLMGALVWRYNPATAGLLSTGIIPVILLSYFLLTNCPGSTEYAGGFLSGADLLGGGGGLPAPGVPPTLIVLIFAMLVIVGIATLSTMSGDDESIVPPDESDEEVSEAAAFARAAGLAADRIEEANVPVDNAVYQAWLQMTTILDLEYPDSTAPREFAEAAIEAGIDRDDVTELTELFTEVRYGGERPEEREDRALEILRRIERTYHAERDVEVEEGG